MEVLMPGTPLDCQALSNYKDGTVFDEFFLEKLNYINRSSDLDFFQLAGNDRIKCLLIAWDSIYQLQNCFDATDTEEILPCYIENLFVNLTHFTISLWFSLEWQSCDIQLRCSLLVSMFRMQEKMHTKISCLKCLDWTYLMNLGLCPWKNTYIKEFTRLLTTQNTENSMANETTTAVFQPATVSDIEGLKLEGLVLSLLRLLKMFDARSMEMVKSFSMRIISAWNKIYQQTPEYCFYGINRESADLKRSLNMICHVFLMTIYEGDSASGFEIDNMIDDIRFYHKSMSYAVNNSKKIDIDSEEAHKTPAHLFALTSVRLNQSFEEFIDSVISDLSRESSSTLFGAISHSYATYLTAYTLIELNKLTDEDFALNIDKYKSLLTAYVTERERSEQFVSDELRKQKLQTTSHNTTYTVKLLINCTTADGKGNCSSNLVNHKPSDVQWEQERLELFDVENERRYDPVFQTMPNNEKVTNEFYDILSKSKYKGWHYAKLVLLLKIIGRELNEIEKWRYHPGLATEFMINLEARLAKRFEHLAHIFQDFIFMEQEFWLTAFYLLPIRYYYDKVMSCGTRFFRTVNLLNKNDRDEYNVKPTEKHGEGNKEINCAFMNAKYGLLSSTFDVKQIANMTTAESSKSDYDGLAKALRTLRLPENIIKDLLTVTFSPRHANFTWAAEWSVLRKRCKNLLMEPSIKRKLVESNMAEANDRLKYLHIDYQKYKNLPQLDYGSIEEGYENDYVGDDLDDDSDESDDFNESGSMSYKKNKFETQEENRSESPKQFFEETNQYANYDDFYVGRRSARRAAAVIASAMLKEDNSPKCVVNKKKDDIDYSDSNEKTPPRENVDITNPALEPTVNEASNHAEDERKEISYYTNSTEGFIPIPDIWNYNKKNIEQVKQTKTAMCQVWKRVEKLFQITSRTKSEIAESIESTESSESSDENCDDRIMNNLMNVSDTDIESNDNSNSNQSNDINASKFSNAPHSSNPSHTNHLHPKKLRQQDVQFKSKNPSPNISKLKLLADIKEELVSKNFLDFEISENESSNDLTLETREVRSDAITEKSKKRTMNKLKMNNDDNSLVTQPKKVHKKRETKKSDVTVKTVEHRRIKPEIQEYRITTSSEDTVVKENKYKSETRLTTGTGKPKSFINIIAAAQEISDESSMQSSNGSQTRTSQCVKGQDQQEIRTTELIQKCLTKKCFVQLKKLPSSFQAGIRQPTVRLKRLNMSKYLEESAASCREKRTQPKPKYFESEGSSSPAPSSTSKFRKRRTSADDSDSEEEYNPKNVNIKRRNLVGSQRSLPTLQKQPRRLERTRTKSFSVVPRSASGLKVCISSNNLCDVRPPDDCIAISSSDDEFPVNFTNVNIPIADEDDPLYEVEADISILR